VRGAGFERPFHIAGALVDNFETRDKAGGWICSNFTMMRYTQTTLEKLEKILDEAEYIVRYERGNFQSGYCILEQRKVVVLNKFLPLEGRISTLIDIIPQLKIAPEMLGPEVRRIYEEVLSASLIP
jgi:hypothetical protein